MRASAKRKMPDALGTSDVEVLRPCEHPLVAVGRHVHKVEVLSGTKGVSVDHSILGGGTDECARGGHPSERLLDREADERAVGPQLLPLLGPLCQLLKESGEQSACCVATRGNHRHAEHQDVGLRDSLAV